MKDNILATLRPGHPRLLAEEKSWDLVRQTRRSDPLLAKFLARSEREARALFTAPPIAYEKSGVRLLHVSRVVLRRVLLLALHGNLTGELAFVDRAKAEMLAAAEFVDWNPSHFLDTAEMTAALAFGYDWLYEKIDSETRRTIETAIVEKGLIPGLACERLSQMTNNWNSVCHGGLTLGALAVAECAPQIAAQTLERARAENPGGLREYAPSGVYPEGPMYWGYGTVYQVALLAACESALGTDWNLSGSIGFLESADALIRQIGPSGLFFNFSDCVEFAPLEPPLWWFAKVLKSPALRDRARADLAIYADSPSPPEPLSATDRLLPLVALWQPSDQEQASSISALPLDWHGPGANPIAVFRSAWGDRRASYLALKGGRASLAHGHMDSGSFVFEANGVRWARDLGMQDYLSLESKGVDLWNAAQDSQRWQVYRLNNFSHNTLTINNQLQNVDGAAAITHFSGNCERRGAIVDLAAAYASQVSSAQRGFHLRSGGSALLIRDELSGLCPGDSVRWTMATRAEIALDRSGQCATLREDGEALRIDFRASSPGGAVAAQPASDFEGSFDAPNPGISVLTFTIAAPESGKVAIAAQLAPSSEGAHEPLADQPLAEWKLERVG